MSTTLTGLRADIQDITENTFTNAQLNLFIRTAEQTLLNTTEIPASRNRQETTFSTDADHPEQIATSTGYLYTYSLAIKDTNNNVVTYLLPKDESFLLEAFPDKDTTGVPAFYAQYDNGKLVVAPSPNANLNIIHTYAAYPTSITTSSDGTSWIGDNMDFVLLYASLVEAAIFMKAEPDVIGMYKEQLNVGLKLFKMLGDGKLNSDVYRNGQPKVDVL